MEITKAGRQLRGGLRKVAKKVQGALKKIPMPNNPIKQRNRAKRALKQVKKANVAYEQELNQSKARHEIAMKGWRDALKTKK